MSREHPGRVIPQDIVSQDGWGDMLTALPISQSEIEDLLYGDDRSTEDRIERLRELAGQLRDEAEGDFGDGDPAALLAEIDAAVARLQGDTDPDADGSDEALAMDDGPTDHRETLAPDSDELDAIASDDLASLTDGSEPLDDDALDPQEWDDSDDVNRGVQRG